VTQILAIRIGPIFLEDLWINSQNFKLKKQKLGKGNVEQPLRSVQHRVLSSQSKRAMLYQVTSRLVPPRFQTL
jgi:hypothetical protein